MLKTRALEYLVASATEAVLEILPDHPVYARAVISRAALALGLAQGPPNALIGMGVAASLIISLAGLGMASLALFISQPSGGPALGHYEPGPGANLPASYGTPVHYDAPPLEPPILSPLHTSV